MEEKKNTFTRPTLNTLFHIDFDWWQENDQNWKSFLKGYLCSYHQKLFTDNGNDDMLGDSIDSDTGEIKKKDILIDIIEKHCSHQEGFLPENGTLTDSVFRLFLSNGNQPLTADQMSTLINRPAGTILKTLSSGRIYRGIKPI